MKWWKNMIIILKFLLNFAIFDRHDVYQIAKYSIQNQQNQYCKYAILLWITTCLVWLNADYTIKMGIFSKFLTNRWDVTSSI